jgi:protein required for attachment to host cells
MKAHKTLFVIADGGRARYVEKRIGEMVFDTVRETVADNAHDHSGDHSGRTHESASSARHGIEARHAPEALRKQDFLRSLAHDLNKARQHGEFERLVLVAPARPLGQLIDALDPETEASIVTRVRKDLTRVPDGHLPEHLADVVYAWRVSASTGS